MVGVDMCLDNPVEREAARGAAAPWKPPTVADPAFVWRVARTYFEDRSNLLYAIYKLVVLTRADTAETAEDPYSAPARAVLEQALGARGEQHFHASSVSVPAGRVQGVVAFVVDVAAAVAQNVAPSPSRPSRVPSTWTRRWNSFRNHSAAAASSRAGNDTEIVHIFAKTIALRAFFVLRHPFVWWWL